MSRTNIFLIAPWLLVLILVMNMYESQLPSWLQWMGKIVPMQSEPELLCKDPEQPPLFKFDKGTIVRQLTNMNDWMMKQAVITTHVYVLLDFATHIMTRTHPSDAHGS
jgi:hypothetical protein